MCPFFEMKIKGMKEFKQINEKIVAKAMKKQGVEQASYLDLAIFSAWISSKKVIDYIFKENPHSELIKRSHDILYIMVHDEKNISEEHLELIWSCCQSEKHEDIVRATFDLLTLLVRNLPPSRVAWLFKRIEMIPVSAIDSKTVQFLKEYSMNTIENLTGKKINY